MTAFELHVYITVTSTRTTAKKILGNPYTENTMSFDDSGQTAHYETQSTMSIMCVYVWEYLKRAAVTA